MFLPEDMHPSLQAACVERCVNMRLLPYAFPLAVQDISHLDECTRPDTPCVAGIRGSLQWREDYRRQLPPLPSNSDREGRYPIIAPIGSFIFCLHSRETAAWEGTNQMAIWNNSQRWINHTNFTRTDRYFASSSRVPFLCRPSACELISVMKHLISHTGATKRKLRGFLLSSGIVKLWLTTSGRGGGELNQMITTCLPTNYLLHCWHQSTMRCPVMLYN